MKKLFVIAIAAFAFTACNNAGKTDATSSDTTAIQPQVTPPTENPAPTEGTTPAPTEGTTPAPTEGTTPAPTK